MLAWLALLAAMTPARASDVLVPEATPASLDDFAVAYMVYDMLATELRDRGVAVSDAEDIASWAGSDAEGCADNDACPANLWDRTEAKLAVVLSVGRGAGGLSIEARVYRRDRAGPVEVVTELVPEGQEQAFAQRLAGQVGDMTRSLALPLDDEEIVADNDDVPVATTGGGSGAKESASKEKETSSKEKETSSKEKDTASKEKEPASKDKEPASKDKPRALTERQESERRKMGIPVAAYRRYVDSGAERASWLEAQRVRTGTAHIDALVGLGAGDVSRGYGVWLHLVNQDGAAAIDGTSTWLGDGAGAGFYAGGAVGYSPFWFFDLSLGAGIQQGQKQLESGWECPECNADTQLVSTAYEPRMGIQLVVEPQARFWLRATGVAKPYLMLGGQLRAFDGFDVPGEEVAWPDAPGGVGFGVAGGAGLALDVSDRVSVLFDVPYTLFLTPRTESTNSDLISSQPAPMNAWGGALRVTAGTSVRF